MWCYTRGFGSGGGAGGRRATLDEAELAVLVAVLAAERALGGLDRLLGPRVEVRRVALGLLEEDLAELAREHAERAVDVHGRRAGVQQIGDLLDAQLLFFFGGDLVADLEDLRVDERRRLRVQDLEHLVEVVLRARGREVDVARRDARVELAVARLDLVAQAALGLDLVPINHT